MRKYLEQLPREELVAAMLNEEQEYVNERQLYIERLDELEHQLRHYHQQLNYKLTNGCQRWLSNVTLQCMIQQLTEEDDGLTKAIVTDRNDLQQLETAYIKSRSSEEDAIADHSKQLNELDHARVNPMIMRPQLEELRQKWQVNQSFT